MAFAFRNPQNDRAVFVRFDNVPVPEDERRVILICGTRVYQMVDPLGISWTGDTIMRLANEYFLFDSLVMKHKEDTIIMAFVDKNGNYSYSEYLVFHQSYFHQFYDFSKTSNIYQLQGHFIKHENVAIFTQVYNESVMLKIWENYYSKIVAARHLYVLDHGSTINLRDIVSSDVNVLSLPRGETDHRHIAHFCNQFHRFLLSHYRWVIHIDVDEILIHKNGFDIFIAQLGHNSEEQIIKAADAYNIVHDVSSETDIDLEQKITLQRTHIVPEFAERKPVIASVPTTWGMGFHSVLENELLVEDENLWVMHLPFMDRGLIAAKTSKWNEIKFSEACQIHIPHTKSSTENDDIAQMLSKKLTDPGTTTLPDWVRGLF